MEAVILAGGKGTRLQPFTNEIPKPLVPVGDTTIIEILLRQLKKGGVERVHIALSHLSHMIMAAIGDGVKLGLSIEYNLEPAPLSTVGPLTGITNLPEHFIVANSDIITDLDVSRLYRAHIDSKALVTVATHTRTERIDFGVLEAGPDNRVTGFVEKPTFDFKVSMGIYVFSRRALGFMPTMRPYGFDQLMLDLLKRNELVMQFPYSGFWLDVGRPDDYRQVLHDWDKIEKLLSW